MLFKDLTGQRFGRLLVLSRAENKGRRVQFVCKCDCGNTITVSANTLKSQHTKSCGCLRKETDLNRNRVHGKYPKRLYVMWTNMKARCSNKNSTSYSYYGGRGITVCNEWEKSFLAFRDWALSNGYSEGLTIDRIDTNGNYEPANCRFATRKEQARNTRGNRLYKGKPIVELCEEYHIDYGYVRRRLNFYKDHESKFFGA